ncbi:type 1 glutamine amidotransferase [Sulfurirhabdus autotrophica]|uniref:GMP synthase-like glutamine amidotransferase n=1 Tax=Sulfurirhabdus autotrophica TaxID=1706046 RepID=A0A4R3XRV9_9PROT|nr:type 1 glutamine amidotransferase [Sulfurirhabdus autotrophica]TCV82355.1 GMP synthase-like glutamine amidotransferase [Sulfurirhabdus autotrophica]
MKPVAIFRHTATEGPGYIATFLAERNIPVELIKIDEGALAPRDPRQFSGLVFMGGPMSVNDDLKWIPSSLALIWKAVASDIPVLGHCLGGQLMAKALGGTVTKNPVKEIGWGEASVLDNDNAREWFGDEQKTFTAFHWHGETFTIPEGTTRILESAYCPNQAFAMGKHLGMQCHVEMTEEMVRTWCDIGSDEIAENPGAAVQTPEIMQQELTQRVKALNAVADKLYSRWLQGVVIK